jgi:hypothetical protein
LDQKNFKWFKNLGKKIYKIIIIMIIIGGGGALLDTYTIGLGFFHVKDIIEIFKKIIKDVF